MIACTAPPWKSESTLLVLWRQRCAQAGHWTVHTQLIFLHDQKMFEVHFQDSGGPAAPSNLAFPNPSVKGLVLHPAKARETRRRIAVASLQLLDLASQSVQLDDVCLQAVPLLLHELNCSCHLNSCPELIFLSSLSCKSCLHSRRRWSPFTRIHRHNSLTREHCTSRATSISSRHHLPSALAAASFTS